MSNKRVCIVILMAAVSLQPTSADTYEDLFERLAPKLIETAPIPAPSATPQEKRVDATSSPTPTVSAISSPTPKPSAQRHSELPSNVSNTSPESSFSASLKKSAEIYPQLKNKPRYNPKKSNVVGWQSLKQMGGRLPGDVWFAGTLIYNPVINWSKDAPYTAWVTDFGSHAATIITERRPDIHRTLKIPKSDPALVLAVKRTQQGRIGAILYWPGH